MRGSELKCPTCSGGAVDVAPDYEVFPDFRGQHLSAPLAESWTSATCPQGHRFAIHFHETAPQRWGFEYLPAWVRP